MQGFKCLLHHPSPIHAFNRFTGKSNAKAALKEHVLHLALLNTHLLTQNK